MNHSVESNYDVYKINQYTEGYFFCSNRNNGNYYLNEGRRNDI